MKRLSLFLAVLSAVALTALTGCTKSEGVDTSKAESAFASAPAADKSAFDQAIAAIKSGDYTAGLKSLQDVASKVKLTPEQQQAIKDLIAQVQSKVGAAAQKAVDDTSKAAKEGMDKAATDANKAADDVKKALGK